MLDVGSIQLASEQNFDRTDGTPVSEEKVCVTFLFIPAPPPGFRLVLKNIIAPLPADFLRAPLKHLKDMEISKNRKCVFCSVWSGLIQSGYRRYLYHIHQGNALTTGGIFRAAARLWLIPAGK